MRLLHLSLRSARCLANPAFRAELEQLGTLRLLTDVAPDPERIAAEVRDCDVYLAGWDSVPLPVSLASDPGALKYICGITGSMRSVVPVELLRAGIPLTNWGDAPAHGVAEGALTLLLAMLKGLPSHLRNVQTGSWGVSPVYHNTLEGLPVALYGMGVIARRFVELLRPFDPVLTAYDPFTADFPEGVRPVQSLDQLVTGARAIIIHAALTDATRGSLSRQLLARLPDHAIIINTARGDILDQSALFDEIAAGRLHAALDVLDPDSPPAPDHPLRQHPHLLLTAHQIAKAAPPPGQLARHERYAIDNLRRFQQHLPLLRLMPEDRYLLST